PGGRRHERQAAPADRHRRPEHPGAVARSRGQRARLVDDLRRRLVHAHPPPAPSTPALLPADDSNVVGDGITNVKQPHLTGTAAPNTTVQLLNAAGTI